MATTPILVYIYNKNMFFQNEIYFTKKYYIIIHSLNIEYKENNTYGINSPNNLVVK